ncbi:MAG: SDR family NAD(P)-dependent oxidoreductase [Candidatus Cloacimonetes bacterium]|nr:SDR family NAD(P)-dependent oxidoreductase [Candidatus Cloacimonadota bacterium]
MFHIIKNLLKIIFRKFKKYVPVYIPTLQSDLLNERVALITGGTRGIGYAIAERFLESGSSVIITGIDKNDIQDACERLKNKGMYQEKVFGIEMDNSDIKNLEKKFNNIIFQIKGQKIDILVNNAGITRGGSFKDILEEDFEEVLNVNLKGTYFLSQLVAKYMQKNKIKGNILNIASSSSLRPAISPYVLSKWGIRGFTLGLAKTLFPYDIVVNGLAPGSTATAMLIKDKYSGIENFSVPAGRYITADEVANMAVILVSSLGRMIVGDIIYMTGGAGIITIDDISYPF